MKGEGGNVMGVGRARHHGSPLGAGHIAAGIPGNEEQVRLLLVVPFELKLANVFIDPRDERFGDGGHRRALVRKSAT